MVPAPAKLPPDNGPRWRRAFVRSGSGRWLGRSSMIRSSATFIATILLALIGIGIFGSARFGSLYAGLTYLAGDRVIIAPSYHVCDVAEDATARGGTHHNVTLPFRVYNCTGRDLRLLGESSSNCTCVTLGGAPALIRAGDSAPITVTVNKAKIGAPGRRSARIELLTDCATKPEISAIILFHRR